MLSKDIGCNFWISSNNYGVITVEIDSDNGTNSQDLTVYELIDLRDTCNEILKDLHAD